jgi:hypothetical protein
MRQLQKLLPVIVILIKMKETNNIRVIQSFEFLKGFCGAILPWNSFDGQWRSFKRSNVINNGKSSCAAQQIFAVVLQR